MTATGRKMIEQTSQIAREEFGAFVVYGDSIPGYEIVTIKDQGRIREMPVEKFADMLVIPWEEYRGFKVGDKEIKNKLYKDIEECGYQTWTHDGYKPIKKIIKHNTTKKLYRITALDENGKQLDSAGPSSPVEIIGLESVPEVGAVLGKETSQVKSEKLKVKSLIDKLREDKKTVLNIIIKADNKGSIEAIEDSLNSLSENIKIISL